MNTTSSWKVSFTALDWASKIHMPNSYRPTPWTFVHEERAMHLNMLKILNAHESHTYNEHSWAWWCVIISSTLPRNFQEVKLIFCWTILKCICNVSHENIHIFPYFEEYFNHVLIKTAVITNLSYISLTTKIMEIFHKLVDKIWLKEFFRALWWKYA